MATGFGFAPAAGGAPLAAELAAVAAAVGQITVEVRLADRAGGSGVIWRPDGLVVTSAHVARAGAEVILPDRRRLPAALVAWDRQIDLALFRIAGRGFPAAVVGDSDRLRAGELVFAVGHPFGLGEAVTAGIVHFAPGPDGDRRRGLIQADLRLAPGNSGGPLADAHGRVVGINAMIGGGLALAVPSRVVSAFVERAAAG
jgi:serine protease Do